MNLPDRSFIRATSVAESDQNQARAIDALRVADQWVLIVPVEGQTALIGNADGDFMLTALAAINKAATLMAAKVILEEELDDV